MKSTKDSVYAEIPVIRLKVVETVGPRGSIGAPGPQGPPGSDALIPTEISTFNNDVPYITPTSDNILTNKTWQGQPIADVYIQGAGTWNAKQNALGFNPENSTMKGAANGYCPLGSDAIIPSIYLPAYVDDVIEYPTFSALPVTGQSGIVYVTIDTRRQYRWSGSGYGELSPSPGSTDQVPEGSVNRYFTDARVLSYITGKNISLFANDAGYLKLATLPAYPVVPANISAFTNDVGYLTAAQLANISKGIVGVDLDNKGSVLAIGQQGYARVPYSGTITEWAIVSDNAGSAVVDVWKAASYPTVANSICGSNKPTLSSGTFISSTNLTGWNTAVNAGDMFGWNLDSVTSVTGLIIELTIQKTIG